MSGRLTFICLLGANLTRELCAERTPWPLAAFYPKVDRAVVSLRSKAGWSWSCVSAIDCNVQTIWVADAYRGDGKRFVVRADEKLTAFLELESMVCACGELTLQPVAYHGWKRRSTLADYL